MALFQTNITCERELHDFVHAYNTELRMHFKRKFIIIRKLSRLAYDLDELDREEQNGW